MENLGKQNLGEPSQFYDFLPIWVLPEKINSQIKQQELLRIENARKVFLIKLCSKFYL